MTRGTGVCEISMGQTKETNYLPSQIDFDFLAQNKLPTGCLMKGFCASPNL